MFATWILYPQANWVLIKSDRSNIFLCDRIGVLLDVEAEAACPRWLPDEDVRNVKQPRYSVFSWAEIRSTILYLCRCHKHIECVGVKVPPPQGFDKTLPVDLKIDWKNSFENLLIA